MVTLTGSAVTVYRTEPHRHPPFCGIFISLSFSFAVVIDAAWSSARRRAPAGDRSATGQTDAVVFAWRTHFANLAWISASPASYTPLRASLAAFSCPCAGV